MNKPKPTRFKAIRLLANGMIGLMTITIALSWLQQEAMRDSLCNDEATQNTIKSALIGIERLDSHTLELSVLADETLRVLVFSDAALDLAPEQFVSIDFVGTRTSNSATEIKHKDKVIYSQEMFAAAKTNYCGQQRTALRASIAGFLVLIVFGGVVINRRLKLRAQAEAKP